MIEPIDILRWYGVDGQATAKFCVVYVSLNVVHLWDLDPIYYWKGLNFLNVSTCGSAWDYWVSNRNHTSNHRVVVWKYV